jgi:hypothetical protein
MGRKMPFLKNSAAIQPHRVSRSRIGLDLLQVVAIDPFHHRLMGR